MSRDRWRLIAALLGILLGVAAILLGVATILITPKTLPAARPFDEKLTPSLVRSGLNGTLDRYRFDLGAYPTSLLDLLRPSSTVAASRWGGPYLREQSILIDAWGRPFRYRAPGTHNPTAFDLSSLGPDGLPNTPDDITNWPNP